MSSRATVHRVSRPSRRSRGLEVRPSSPKASSLRIALQSLLREKEAEVARRLREIRDGHPAGAFGASDAEDWTQGDVSQELEARLLEREAEARGRIREALLRGGRRDRIACAECGQPIGERRLLALPFTDVCRACQEAREADETRRSPMLQP
jgi:DnaK suppressor protein